MTVGTRREARERALSLLYEAEAKGTTVAAVLADLPLPADPFSVDLVNGVERQRDVIDQLIERFSIDWTIDRMPVVDRTVLRLAIYELLDHADVPTAAVLSEAVELAKQYSTEDSGRFVNGVLAAVALEVRP
ncbi:MAG TPA: transcription antitermination factor NusB [Acidimicrobiales bacterium]|nr:transcription antitermination factor NusB [Acidimicrobiales bacterium]